MRRERYASAVRCSAVNAVMPAASFRMIDDAQKHDSATANVIIETTPTKALISARFLSTGLRMMYQRTQRMMSEKPSTRYVAKAIRKSVGCAVMFAVRGRRGPAVPYGNPI